MKTVALVGLGYVGLPIACALAREGFPLMAFDIDSDRIKELSEHHDRTGECDPKMLDQPNLIFTGDPQYLKKAEVIIITVPTPVDKANRPDLRNLTSASLTVGENLSPGSVVVIESTVYPGVTEDICVPILEKASGLKANVGFKFGYCPERINPGDKNHTLDKVIKVISGSDEQALGTIASVYEKICKAGLWKAPNIKTAEAAKVIENIQRDLNIAFMNELSILFDKVGVVTRDVLDAAATKWNFHRYFPGLVGGHCIGVDPYYLTHLAETVGYHPQLILAGRQINDSMADHVADQLLLGLVKTGKVVNQSKVLILGVTFKENIPDIRNSKVSQVIQHLKKYGVEVHACDPHVSSEKIRSDFAAIPVAWPLPSTKYQAVVLAVAHETFKKALSPDRIENLLALPGTFMDVKWVYKKEDFSKEVFYESL